jgi:hypothetical protein
MNAFVTLAKIWRTRKVDVVRPVLARGSVVGESIRRARKWVQRY